MITIAVDAETFAIQPGLLAPPAVCWSFAQRGHPPWLLEADRGASALEAMLDQVQGPTVIVGANIAYDMAVACAYRSYLVPKVFAAYEAGRIRDVQIRAQLTDIAAGRREDGGGTFVRRGDSWVPARYSLADLEMLHLGNDRFAAKKGVNAWRLRYAELRETPLKDWPADARQYPLDDAAGTLAVYEAQGGGCLVDEREQCYAAWALHLASCHGMRTDPVHVAALRAEVEEKFARIQIQMRSEKLVRTRKATKAEREAGTVDLVEQIAPRATKAKPNPAPVDVAMRYSKDQAAIAARVVAAYEKLGAPTPMTPTGRVSQDADTLKYSGDALLAELSDSGPTGTIRNTFLPVLESGTVRPINTRFRTLLGTGRISSSEPNLNNIPRSGGVREGFVPRPGFVLCSIDLNCAELRSHAQVNVWLFGLKHVEMAKFFQANPNGDPHLELAASQLKITGEEALARKKAKDPELIDRRQGAKPVNFGFPGGMGPNTFIQSARKNYGVHFTEREARKAKADWLKRWPEMSLYFEYIDRTVRKNHGRIMQMRPPGPNGEHTPHRWRGELDYCAACNTLFQGLTADAMKAALCAVSKECYVDGASESSALFGSRPVGFLYDEILAELPVATAHEAAHRMRDVIVAECSKWTPDIPVTAEPALMTRWYKGAEPVYVEGRLVPWAPAGVALL